MADEQVAGGDERGGEAVEAGDVDLRGGGVAADDLVGCSRRCCCCCRRRHRRRRRRCAGRGRTSDQGDERRVGVRGWGTGVLFVDDEAAVAGDEVGVDDVDVCAGVGGDVCGEAFDEGGEEGGRVCDGGEGSFVDEVEGCAGFLVGAAGMLLARFGVVLRVEGAHFLDQAYERLQFLVFFGQDEGCVDGAAGEVAAEDGEHLFADVDADVFLGFDC